MSEKEPKGDVLKVVYEVNINLPEGFNPIETCGLERLVRMYAQPKVMEAIETFFKLRARKKLAMAGLGMQRVLMMMEGTIDGVEGVAPCQQTRRRTGRTTSRTRTRSTGGSERDTAPTRSTGGRQSPGRGRRQR